MKLVVTGGCGLTGSILLKKISEQSHNNVEVTAIVRETTNRQPIEDLNLNLSYNIGDSSSSHTWKKILKDCIPDVVIHIASINHLSVLLDAFEDAKCYPHLVVIGSTGVYSQYRQASQRKQEMEQRLRDYKGSYCLLRPTMIYGSPRDKNIHRLVQFCDRYGFFPVFGSGENLLQPIHAEDLAQALFTVYQNPNLQGAYDLSGGTIISFKELLNLVGQYLGKPVPQVSLPLNIGVWSATLLETVLKSRSPVRREQILRLQEDKAFPHDRASQEFGFSPRPFAVGLQQEVELMRKQGLISG